MDKNEAIKRMHTHWNGLERKMRGQIADAVKLYCSWGLSIKEVARELKRSQSWVQEHLDLAIVNDVRGGDRGAVPPKRDAIRDITEKFKSEPEPEYVAEYEDDGFTPDVAKRLATTYGAAEVAIEKGLLKEVATQEKEKTEAVVFGPQHKWQKDLDRLCNQVKSASRTLDQAKISDLKKVGSRKAIASAHAKWMEQIERLQNFHPEDFDAEVKHHAP